MVDLKTKIGGGSQPIGNNQNPYNQTPNPNYNQQPNPNYNYQQQPTPMPQKPKKPWYKRFWVWFLIVVLACLGIGAMSGNNDNGSSSKSNSSQSSSTKNSSDDSGALSKTYKVGETVNYKGYALKVNSVKWYKGSDVDEPDSGKQYCIVNVTLTNKDAEDKWEYNPFDFKLNDNGNNVDLDEAISDYPNLHELQDGSLDKGASVTGDMVAQANPNSPKLQLQYQTDAWDDNQTLNINLK